MKGLIQGIYLSSLITQTSSYLEYTVAQPLFKLLLLYNERGEREVHDMLLNKDWV